MRIRDYQDRALFDVELLDVDQPFAFLYKLTTQQAAIARIALADALREERWIQYRVGEDYFETPGDYGMDHWDAIVSKALEGLMIPLGFEFKDTLSQQVIADAAPGTNNLYSNYVPEGEIWVVQAAYARNSISVCGYSQLLAVSNGISISLDFNMALPISYLLKFNGGEILLKAGDRMRAIFTGCTEGDSLLMSYAGYKVIAP